MYTVRAYIDADLPKVYECIKLLLKSHIGQGTKLLVGEKELGRYINAGHLSCLVLVQVTECPDQIAHSEVVGCMVYHKDTSIIYGGQGVFLDQYFIHESHRKKGNGRFMMRELCFRVLEEGGTHIKLTFQDGLGLEKMYTAMGFRNHTRFMNGLHVFEIYGRKKMFDFVSLKPQASDRTDSLSFRGISIGNTYSQTLVVETRPESVSQGNLVYSQPLLIIAGAKSKNTAGFKECMLQERTSSDQGLVGLDISSSSDRSELGLPFNLLSLCTYVEVVSVCPWSGPMIYMTEFNGDLRVFSTEFLQNRVKMCLNSRPDICGVILEVPCGTLAARPTQHTGRIITEPDLKWLKHNPLSANLLEFGATDISLTEGWNIAYLDQEGMINLTKNDSKKAM